MKKAHKKTHLKKVHVFAVCLLGLVVAAVCCLLAKEQPRRLDTPSIPVLGYHHLASDADKLKSWFFDPWTASLSTFEKQMQYLHDHGYQTISLDDFFAWYKGEKQFDNKTVVLTFDDSYYSTVALAKPILEKYGFQASVFVIGSSIPEAYTAYQPPAKSHIPGVFLQSDETLQFYSHFHGLHRKIEGEYAVDAYTAQELSADIRRAGEAVSTDYMAYPYGVYNDRVQTALKSEGGAAGFQL